MTSRSTWWRTGPSRSPNLRHLVREPARSRRARPGVDGCDGYEGPARAQALLGRRRARRPGAAFRRSRSSTTSGWRWPDILDVGESPSARDLILGWPRPRSASPPAGRRSCRSPGGRGPASCRSISRRRTTARSRERPWPVWADLSCDRSMRAISMGSSTISRVDARRTLRSTATGS